MIISEKLKELLNSHEVSVEAFINLASAEGFSQSEVDDVSYMEDKFDVWKNIGLID